MPEKQSVSSLFIRFTVIFLRQDRQSRLVFMLRSRGTIIGYTFFANFTFYSIHNVRFTDLPSSPSVPCWERKIVWGFLGYNAWARSRTCIAIVARYISEWFYSAFSCQKIYFIILYFVWNAKIYLTLTQTSINDHI